MRAELTAERRHTGNLLTGNLIDPLHEIIGYASVLKGEARIMSPSDIQGFVRNIISGAETLNQRFENFLLLSLIQSHSLIISPPETIALHKALADLAGQTARRHLRANSLRMTLEPVTVAVSSQLLFKAVSKTVDNACRYSTTSQPIDISLSATPTEFSVNLRDHGVGMSERALTRLETDDFTNGFGLRVSQQLTEALGGKWHLESQPGHGVTVTLTVPLS